MKIIDCIQGTPQWYKARAGIPTASEFGRILTPAKLQLSADADAYENRLVAERLTGEPIMDFKGTREMERGKELEADAFAFYEMMHGVECRHVGFITNDAGTYGGSPDAICDDIAGVELKCPGPQTHVGYLLNPESLYLEYKPQVQGNLFISGLKFWDIMSYHPTLSPVIKRVEPDYAYMGALSKALKQLEINIQDKIERIRNIRHG